MGGAGVIVRLQSQSAAIPRTGSTSESGWVILVMWTFATVCVIKHRGDWGRTRRILFVLSAPLLHGVAMMIVALITWSTLGAFLLRVELEYLAERTVAFLGSLPIVVIAMRHSSLFVRELVTPPPTGPS
jgi:hypothetical protein